MSNDWQSRLREVIEADHRSPRRLSEEVGGGINYVQQILKDGKDPGFSRLSRLLSVLGTSATLYVIMGVRVTPEAENFLRLALSLHEDDKRAVREAVLKLKDAPSCEESLSGPAD